MRKIFFLALLLVGLAGCATAPAPYGNFIQNSAQANDKKVVDDVVKKLVALYPPASTRFDLQHVTPDYFGTYLVESMRAKGYAVLEFKPERRPAPPARRRNRQHRHRPRPACRCRTSWIRPKAPICTELRWSSIASNH